MNKPQTHKKRKKGCVCLLACKYPWKVDGFIFTYLWANYRGASVPSLYTARHLKFLRYFLTFFEDLMPGGRSVRITDILNFENNACAENFFTFAPNFNEAQSEHHSNWGSRKGKKKPTRQFTRKSFHVFTEEPKYLCCVYLIQMLRTMSCYKNSITGIKQQPASQVPEQGTLSWNPIYTIFTSCLYCCQ